MILRHAGAGDAEAMAAVHAAAFEAPWSAHEIGAFAAGPGGFAFAAEADGALAGFVLGRAIAAEAEILTLATAPSHRRRGVARALVEAAAATARAAGAAALVLEVAADNDAALGLYAGAGFSRAGVRRGYYARAGGPPGDALVLRRAL